jgi:hypothetical protein
MEQRLSKNFKVGIIGATGAVGVEIVKCLSIRFRLPGTSLGESLFAALPRPAPRPGSFAVPPRRPAAASKKLLAGMGPRRTPPLRPSRQQQPFPEPGLARYPTTLSRAPEEVRGLDFLLHVLGPVAMEALSQCARLSLSAYLRHVGEKSVREKYCLTCWLSQGGAGNCCMQVNLFDSPHVSGRDYGKFCTAIIWKPFRSCRSWRSTRVLYLPTTQTLECSLPENC